MRLYDISFPHPEENILFDEVLLQMAEKGDAGESLRFWESEEYFIVLGRTGKALDEVNCDKALKANIPVLQRSSGGGTVVQGKGCLNFSVVLSKEGHPVINDITKSYPYILDKVIAALDKVGVKTAFQPISDLATIEDKKVSGNAQKRGRRFVLHHGTVLYDFDVSKIVQFLQMPVDVPEYRRGRTHEDFVTNVLIDKDKFKSALAECFNVSDQTGAFGPIEKKYLFEHLNQKSVIININEFLTDKT